MKSLLPLAAAAAFLVNGAAMAKSGPFSITVSGSCDHLTVTESNGVYYGTSDTAGCDESSVIGGGKGKKFTAAGDLGLGASYAWVWSFVLGKGGAGTATLTGTDGTDVFGPSTFSVTYTGNGKFGKHANNGLPSAISVFRSTH